MSSTATDHTTADTGAEEKEIKKEPTTTETGTNNGSGDAPAPPRNTNKYEGITKLRDFLRTRRLELGLLVSRLVTIFFCVFYIFPIFGMTTLFFRRALFASAITSAMRLYQRLPPPYSLTREFFMSLVLEDSCHYLFYSILFLYFGHITFSLIPILLYSLLHAASFILGMMEKVKGPAARYSGLGSFLSFCTSRTTSVLKMVAMAEVGLMAVILFNSFMGSVSILAIFVYYRFLYLRYASKRNHGVKTVFHEMRLAAEDFITKGCPTFIAKMITITIAILCKLAPDVPNS